ncbi:MAG: redoxin family protein [Gemmatimonadaceae bacterium]|nr:redoxin family protein [Gemmatimonadaceae bacterium]
MALFLLYLAVFCGGLLTILSPCILPVLPFVFTYGGRPFSRHTLWLLAGLVLSFVAVATVGTLGALWIASAADFSRIPALFVLALAGASLMSPRVAAWVTRPFVRVGTRLTLYRVSAQGQDAATDTQSPGRALVLGLATGLLWAPCAGPILGFVAAAAAGSGRPAFAASMFATFGAGAAFALAGGIALSGRALSALRGMAGARVDIWARRVLGATALATAFLLIIGWDARVFSSGGLVQTAAAEELVLDRLVPDRQLVAASLASRRIVPAPIPTPDEGPLPSFDGATGWLNTGAAGSPLTAEQLRGKVVVVNVWTFECYNCLNVLPHVKALAAKYRGRDVVVVGVHTPELARERVPGNVADAVRRLGVTYPVALDANYGIWRAFNNQYWPSLYIADKRGRIRFHHFGEGRYEDEDRVVEQLLSETESARAKKIVPAGRAD